MRSGMRKEIDAGVNEGKPEETGDVSVVSEAEMRAAPARKELKNRATPAGRAAHAYGAIVGSGDGGEALGANVQGPGRPSMLRACNVQGTDVGE